MYRSQRRIFKDFDAAVVQEYDKFDNCTRSSFLDRLNEFNFPFMPKLTFHDTLEIENNISSPLLSVTAVLDGIAAEYDIATLEKSGDLAKMKFSLRFSVMKTDHYPIVIKCLNFLYDFIALSELNDVGFVAEEAMRVAIMFTQFVDTAIAGPAIRLFAVSCVESKREPPYNVMRMIMHLLTETPLDDGSYFDSEPLLTLVEYITEPIDSNTEPEPDVNDIDLRSIREISVYRYKASLQSKESRMMFLDYFVYAIASVWVVFGEKGFEQHVTTRCPALVENVINCLRLAPEDAKTHVLPAVYCALVSFRQGARQELIKRWNFTPLFSVLLDTNIDVNELYQLAELISISPSEELAIFMLPLAERLNDLNDYSGPFPEDTLYPQHIGKSEYSVLKTKEVITLALAQLIGSLSSNRYSLPSEFFSLISRCFHYDFDMYSKRKSLQFMSIVCHWLAVFADLNNFSFTHRVNTSDTEHMFLNAPVINDLFALVSTPEYFESTVVEVIREAAILLESFFCSPVAGPKFILHNSGYYTQLLNGTLEVLKLPNSFDAVVYLPSILNILEVTSSTCTPEQCLTNIKLVWNSFQNKLTDLVCINSPRVYKLSETAIDASVHMLNSAYANEWINPSDFKALDILFIKTRDILYDPSRTEEKMSISLTCLLDIFNQFYDSDACVMDFSTDEGCFAFLEVGIKNTGLLNLFVPEEELSSNLLKFLVNPDIKFKWGSDSELASAARVVAAELHIFSKYVTVNKDVFSSLRDRLPPKMVIRHLLYLLSNKDKMGSQYVTTIINAFFRGKYFSFFTSHECFEFYNQIVDKIARVAEMKSTAGINSKSEMPTGEISDLKSAISILDDIDPDCYCMVQDDNSSDLRLLLERLVNLWVAVYDNSKDYTMCYPILVFMKRLGPNNDLELTSDFFKPVFTRLLSSNKVHTFVSLIRAFEIDFDVWDHITEEVVNFRLSYISNYRSLSKRYDEEDFFSREQSERILKWCLENFDAITELNFVETVEPLLCLVDNIISGLYISNQEALPEPLFCDLSLQLCDRIIKTLNHDFQLNPLIICYLHRIWLHTLYRLPYAFNDRPSGDIFLQCFKNPLLINVSFTKGTPAASFADDKSIYMAIENIIAQMKIVLMDRKRTYPELEAFLVAATWLISVFASSEPRFLVKTVECNYLQLLIWALNDRLTERQSEAGSESNSEENLKMPLGEALRIYCHDLISPGPVLDNMMLQTVSRDDSLTGCFKVPVLNELRDLDISVIFAPHATEIIQNNLIEIPDSSKHSPFLFNAGIAGEIYSKAGLKLALNQNENIDMLDNFRGVDETYLNILGGCVSTLVSVLLESNDGHFAETVISSLIDMAETTKYFGLALLKLYPEDGKDGVRDMLLRFGTQKQTNDPRSNAKPMSPYTSDALIKLLVSLTEVPLDSGFDDTMYTLAKKLSRKVFQAVKYVISNDLVVMTQTDFPGAVSLFHVCCDIIEDCVSIDKSPLKTHFNYWAKQNGDPYTLAIARDLDLFTVVAQGFSLFDPGNLDVAACGTCYWSFIQEFLSLENFAFSSAHADDEDSEADEDYANNQRRLHENRMIESRNNGGIFRNSVLADFDTDVDMEDEILDSDNNDSSVINVADSDEIISIEDEDGEDPDGDDDSEDYDGSLYSESGSSDNIMTVDSDFELSGDEDMNVNMNFDVVLDGDVDMDSDGFDLLLNPEDFSDDGLYDENDLGMDEIGLLDRLLTWYDEGSRADLLHPDESHGDFADDMSEDSLDPLNTSEDYSGFDSKAEYAAILFRSSGYPDSSKSYILANTVNTNVLLTAWRTGLTDLEWANILTTVQNTFVENAHNDDNQTAGLVNEFREYVNRAEQLYKKEQDSRALVKNDTLPRSTCLSLYMSVIGRMFFGPMVLSEDIDELQTIASRLLQSVDGRNTAIAFFKEFLDELSRGGMNVLKLFKKLTSPLIGKFNQCTPLPFHFDNLTTASLVCVNIVEFLSMFIPPSNSHHGTHFQPAEQRRIKLFCNALTESLGDKLIVVLTRSPIAKNVKLLQRMTYIVNELFKCSFSSSVQVSRKTQSKLVSLLGSKSCTSHSFSSITELIKSNLNVSELVVFIVDELRKAKSVLLSVSSTFFDQLSEGTVSLQTTDSFFINQIKLLRLLSLVNEVYTGQETMDIYREINLFPLWQVVAQQFSRANGMHTKGFATCIMLLETIAIPSVSVFKWRESRQISVKPDSKDKEEHEKADNVAKTIETFVTHFLNKHKVLVNQILKVKPNLALGPLGQMASIYNVLDFENKRRIFNQNIKEIKSGIPLDPQLIKIHRDTIFEDSYKFFVEHNLRKEYIKIHFDDEFGEDVGGLTREWLNVLSNVITDARNLMLKPALAGSSVHSINEKSSSIPDYLNRFKFVGWMIARAIFDDRTVGIHFIQPIYKHLLHKSVGVSDMKDVDEEYAKSLMWMLENDITDIIFENMSVESTANGVTKIVELIPNGANIPVTEDNKEVYVNKIVEYKLFESVKPQLEALREGFHLVLELEDYNMFNEKELELMVCGLPTIDIDDWHRNTNYDGYSLESPQIKWFWSIVAAFSAEERAKLLQFCTGTSRVPVGGFSNLQSVDGTDKFLIHKLNSSTSHLPTSHTCMNQLDLPAYESSRKMKAMLLKAITEGNVGFGFV